MIRASHHYVNRSENTEQSALSSLIGIVISDIQMPVIDGLELIRHVHESQFFPHFILISGYKEFEYARTALKYGVEDYLLKSVNETELNQILKKVCSEHNQMLSENTKIHIDMHENNYYFMNVI